ncbi:MAG: acetate--CoA ligase family protein [Candidatus Levyibacteriota bacterium]
MAKALENLLVPKSIAVIGASASAEKVGAIVLKNIISSGFTGKIYPVNPKEDNIQGITCFHDIASLPEVVDLAVVAIPSLAVNQTLTQIGEKGIKNVVVFSAGYKEIGAEGKTLEDELISIAQKFELNIIGPNCLGYVNNTCPVNVTFGQLAQNPGVLRFVSQSGALAASLFDFCNATGLGFESFITMGNKSVLNENDFLSYFLAQDENQQEVKPVGLYLESISDGKEFLQITSKLSKRNPIFIIKPGKSTAASKAMQSHTGAIAGEDSVLQAALAQAGVIRCSTLEDYFDLSRAFAWEKAPEGLRVAIVSNAGGPAVISADAVVAEGLELVDLGDETRNKLHEFLPRFASVLNPVDVLGDALADRVAQAAETILETNRVDALVVILTPQVMTQIEKTAQLIGDLGKKYQKPIFCSFIGGTLVAQGEKVLNDYHIPSFRFPERAIWTIGAMAKWRLWQKAHADEALIETAPMHEQANLKIRGIIQKALENNQSTLDNLDANEILTASSIPTPPTQEVTSLEEAKSFIDTYKWPVVMKLSSPGLLHKADIGAIVKDVSDEGALEGAFINLDNKIQELPPELRTHVKKQIQKDILSGIEVLVGVKRDPNFGPVLLFGAGGTLAELILDRNLHLLPIDPSKAKELVESSKIYKLLKGYRGEPPYALDKLYDVIVKLSSLIESLPEVTDIEVNPLIVTQNDVWAVDGKVILKHEEKPTAKLPNFHTATTIEAAHLASTFHYFVFETVEPMQYTAGQYISVKVANTRINCYSIAAIPGDNKFALLVDTSPGGPGSKYFDNLRVGEKITYLGPLGTFTFKEDGAKHLLFLGTGSGISPLRNLIDDLLKVQHVTTPISLYFGLRYPADVFWKDYFEGLEKEFPNFKFTLVISKPDESWHGNSGHITDFVQEDFPDASSCSAYLCGNKLMVEEAINMLSSKGCPKERVYTEKF